MLAAIDHLPDLTHPMELLDFAHSLGSLALLAFAALAVLGLVLGWLSRSLSSQSDAQGLILGWARLYERMLQSAQHIGLTLALLGAGLLLCTTLANRSHHWEQARLEHVAYQADGELMTQNAPSATYEVEAPISIEAMQAGKLVEVHRTRRINQPLELASSKLDVVVHQLPSAVDPDHLNYHVSFQGGFDLVSRFTDERKIALRVPRPTGTALLTGFGVKLDGQALTPDPNDASIYTVFLGAGGHRHVDVAYNAQGDARWVFDAGGAPLADFNMVIHTDFSGVHFAGGFAPSTSQNGVYAWSFKDNVAVAHPFGVFTAIEPPMPTAAVSRVLLLAPAICAWWLLVLYATAPLGLRQLPLAAGGFFAGVMLLGYAARVMPPLYAWALVAMGLVLLSLGLASGTRGRAGTALVTALAAALPLLALLLSHTGLVLSVAAVLSAAWVVGSQQVTARPHG